MSSVRVWDPLLRIAHWTLVASILAAWITSEMKFDAAKRAHEWVGYAALAVIALRLAWGWTGPIAMLVVVIASIAVAGIGRASCRERV